MKIKSNDLNKIYIKLCKKLNKAQIVDNTKELNNVLITLTDINKCFISNNYRVTPIRYILAESIWYAYGSNDLDFIGRFASLWYKVSDDNKTCNSAYGYIMRKKYGFDQIFKVIEILKKDPYSRRAIININEANENIIETKDEQCTIYLQFYIRNNKLNMLTVMRSNDINYGLVNDIPAFIAIQKYIAEYVGIEPGEYNHFVNSLHCYQKDYELIYKISKIRKYYNYRYDVDFFRLYEFAECIYDDCKKGDPVDICLKWGIIKKK